MEVRKYSETFSENLLAHVIPKCSGQSPIQQFGRIVSPIWILGSSVRAVLVSQIISFVRLASKKMFQTTEKHQAMGKKNLDLLILFVQ
jgi:hypothetical protein